jgi:hypothetical protein
MRHAAPHQFAGIATIRQNYSGEIAAWNAGQRSRGEFAGDVSDIARIDSGSAHLDQHFAWTGIWFVNLFDGENIRGAEGVKSQGFHGGPSEPGVYQIAS